MTTDKTQAERLAEVGASAFASIADMVAALQCDYDRLQELRDERDDYEPEENPDGSPVLDANGVAMTWADANPDDAEELAELEAAAGDCTDRDDAEQRIQEDPLSLQFRSGRWTTDRQEMQADEYRLLLSTGGPAVQIVGDIGTDGADMTARLQVQDWFTPWTDYACDEDTLLVYVSQFYMGE